MHFAVDAHAIGRRLTGNEVYVRNLLTNLAALDRKAKFTAYLSTADATSAVPTACHTRHVALNPFVRLGFDLSRLLREDRPDLVHVQYTAPIACPVPVVVSVHDISYLERPDFFRSARAKQLQFTVAHTVRKAARVLTPSEFSRRGVIRSYGLPDEAVCSIPMAVSPLFRPIQREAALAHVLARYSITAPFILTVGDLQPRKNHVGLIEAYSALIDSIPQLQHHLVFVGKDTWYAEEVRRAAARSRFKDRIHFTGFVPDDDLVNLYNASELFVFPSFYEGFGIPILEAMACGRAVACSNTSAMPEVANAAGLLFDPASRDELVRALRDLLLESELKTRMERLGQQRAASFTWQRTAEMTLKVYYEVAGSARVRPAMTSAHRTA